MKIPTEWQTIAPTGQELTATEVEVERLRREGFSEERVCCRMHIRREHLHEIIYEINRKKAVAARVAAETEEKAMRGKLTPEQRVQVVEMAQQGVMQKDIAQKMGVTPAAISQIIAAERIRNEPGLAERDEAQQESRREPEGAEPVQVSAPENPAAESALGTAKNALETVGRAARQFFAEQAATEAGMVAREAREAQQAERAARVLADAARDRIRADEAEIERQETIIREARKRLMAAAQEIDDLKAWLRQQTAAREATA